ncbi:MAG TPA: biopolymer transporter ExbD [Cyclobacteriaceae bacterium]|nr:biopolymer transporter ExbD [Cyclobacteriaceae bacterium]HMV10251.1 biopolymer transporter ExbD [Cyclobacteriaceae bacterium]HMV89512.1 biopolymer transporter ExbD [Cyclobacteriaceae bacterium]HMW99731.1 biopolymer transporter ExbD [Cyclobacteriaceae bacterium]HMX50123.1 biopolymer transporter ExbD [Cyclobacteriaceae bacterium]
MAELGGGGGGGKKKGGKVRVKKSSTRIDMTPMVDLAFLLLTFFVMTTTLNKPQAMQINMPDKPKEGDEQPEVNERNVLTLVLGENDKIYWYIGITDPKVEVTNFSATGIRKVLQEKKAENPKIIVLIKSLDEARYKNMVDIMDEMSISSMQRFALVEITDVDKELVKESEL